MKELIINIKNMAKNNRGLLFAMIALLASSIVFIIITLTNIRPSNLQIKYRYVNFGEGFYDNMWYYLYAFPIVGALFGIFHLPLAIKTYSRKNTTFTAILIGVSFLLLFMSFFVTSKLFGINEGLI